MVFRATFVVILLSLLVSTARADDSPKATARKQTTALDIVPEEVVAAIAIRNVTELTERGDQFITKTELKVPMRLSEAYGFVTSFLGIGRGLDKKGAAALMLCKPELKEEGLVLAVPVADFKAMAANFGLDRDRLVEGKVIDRKSFQDVKSMEYVRYLAVRGNHLLMGGSAASVELAAKGRSLRESLPKDDRETLDKDDILLYGNTKLVKDEWQDELKRLMSDLDEFPEDEANVLREIAAASNELNHLAVGVRLHDGLGATVLLQFKGDKSRSVLTRLQGDKSKTSLAGLPAGRVIAAHAATGDGDKSAVVARALLQFLLQTFSLKTDEFVSAGHRSNFVGVFGEGWQRINGSRTALYENQNPASEGLFSLVAILETDDAEQFITDMSGLARFVNASGLSPDDFGETIDVKTIQQLIAELGHDQYRVRQLATTKLGLVGKPALPDLEKAANSGDMEVRFRARSVRQQINNSLAGERADLLKRDLLARIKPNFAYFPKQETRSGRPIDFVQLQLQIDEAPVASRLKNLLGPQWSKMRLATVDNRVIALLGSNTSLLDRAIANAKSGDAGIESGASYVTFRTRAQAERTVEFHLSLARAQQLVASEPRSTKPADSNTSFGLSIAPQRIRFDVFSPFEEVKAVVKRMGW